MCFNDSRQFGTHAGSPMDIVPQPAGAPMEILPALMRGLTMPPLDRPAAPQPQVRQAGPVATPLREDQLSGLLMAAYQGHQPAIDMLRQHGYELGSSGDGSYRRAAP